MQLLTMALLSMPAFSAPVPKDTLVSLPDVAEQVVRGVVSVTTRTAGRGQGAGSGVLIDTDGLIVTNHHVVAGAGEVWVTLHDGQTFVVDVVGTDPAADVALLRMHAPPAGLEPLQWGDSDALRLGETVLAVGNPFGMGHTLTRGIVSAKGRAGVGMAEYEDYIQTDAAINPGNSGGALVDLQGRLVGIPTMILSRNGGSNGIGLAISSRLARSLAEDLADDGRVDRGWLGVAIGPAPNGVLLRGVGQGSAAEQAGLRSSDVVLSYNGTTIADLTDFRTRVAMSGSASPFEMEIERGGKRQTIRGVLGRRPDRVQ